MYSYTNTTAIAPIGSMMMPSHFKILLMFFFGLTLRNSGAITVGPVTQTSAPNNSATFGSISNSR